MRNIRTAWIIHLFAGLHAIVALSCRYAGLADELLLTILTMAMALIVCMKKNLSIEFTASIVIIVNIIGFLMGTLGASLLELLISSPYLVHALSTAITTEILGWSILAIAKIFRASRRSRSSGTTSASYFKWILLAAAGIFVSRLFVVLIFSSDPIDHDLALDMTGKVLSNSVALSIIVCLNIIYVRFAGKKLQNSSKLTKSLFLAIFMTGVSLLEAILVSSGLPFAVNNGICDDFMLLFVVSLITQITVYCIVYMGNYAITVRTEMHAAREKAHKAQYRYVNLKRQVNPHFLFNSLNILDCLVCEEKTEQASIYIHKLAGIYRYMIKSEDEDVVPLREELVFVKLYVDLLNVRFPEGFKVETDVPEELMSKYVLPCSIQLLIENATKHNAIRVDDPLVIKVEAKEDTVCVSNNIVPKITRSPSTGLGQKYIRQQYMDLSEKSIMISQTDSIYSVTLPLL